MASQQSWWSAMDDVDDQTLRNIVKYGKIEDIVSKERISTKIRTAVDGVLSKIRSLKTDTNLFMVPNKNPQPHYPIDGLPNIQQLLNLIRRMPKLDDFKFLAHWDDEDTLSQLATINQCLSRNPGGRPFQEATLLNYIESVKKIRPDYDASEFDYPFRLDGGTIPLMEKYPDLKLKLYLPSLETLQPYSSMCRKLMLTSLNGADQCDRSKLYPSVEYIQVFHGHFRFSDLKLFPNLKKLEMYPWKISIRNFSPYLRPGLRCLIIEIESFDPEDFVALSSIINTQPLVELKLDVFPGPYPKRQLLDVILNSPTCKLKSLSFSGFTFARKQFSCTWDLWQELFTDRELLLRLFLKLKRTKYFRVGYKSEHMPMEVMEDISRQVESADRRRSKLCPM